MTIKIVAALITFSVHVAAALVILFFMLIMMNGFSESDASWGLGAFIALSLAIAVLMGLLAVIGVHLFIKKGFSRVIAVLLPVTLCSIIGVIAEMISSVLGIAIADFVRRNY